MPRVFRQTRREALPHLRQLLAQRPHTERFILRSPADIRAFCREDLARQSV